MKKLFEQYNEKPKNEIPKKNKKVVKEQHEQHEQQEQEEENIENIDLECFEPSSPWAKRTTMKELKKNLEKLNLPTTGNKAKLLEELRKYVQTKKGFVPDDTEETKVKVQNKLTCPIKKSKRKTINISGYNCIHDKQNNIYFVLNDRNTVIGFIPEENVKDENVNVKSLTKSLVVLAQNLKLDIDLFNVNLDQESDHSENENENENEDENEDHEEDEE
jgi:hypothetical protein